VSPSEAAARRSDVGPESRDVAELGRGAEGLSPGGWQDFEVVSRETPHGGARLTVPAQVGYPYRLWLLVTYALTEQGLTISVETTNTGPDPAPFGASIHPYLGAGAGVVDGWVLELPAARVLTVTADRLVPVDPRPVAELDRFDFRRPRTIGHFCRSCFHRPLRRSRMADSPPPNGCGKEAASLSPGVRSAVGCRYTRQNTLIPDLTGSAQRLSP
jgi:hypothetical protein